MLLQRAFFSKPAKLMRARTLNVASAARDRQRQALETSGPGIYEPHYFHQRRSYQLAQAHNEPSGAGVEPMPIRAHVPNISWCASLVWS